MDLKEAIDGLNYMISDACTDSQWDFVYEIELAIEALEKQIPKKPVMYDEDSLLCPLCDCFIGYASEAHDDDVYQDKFSYCSYCGQAIDWSGMDE